MGVGIVLLYKSPNSLDLQDLEAILLAHLYCCLGLCLADIFNREVFC